MLNHRRLVGALSVVLLAGLAGACRSPARHLKQADEAALRLIERSRERNLPEAEPFSLESPAGTLRRRLMLDQQLPGTIQPDTNVLAHAALNGTNVLTLSLADALAIGARHSREYQSQKEDIFIAALNLDVQHDEFRNSYAGLVSSILTGTYSGEEDVEGVSTRGTASLSRRLGSGATLTSRLAVDLVKLLTLDRSSSLGIVADATVSIPLLRGAGRDIVTEGVTQAERNVLYAMRQFERFKRTFTVDIASGYLGVLEQRQRLRNAASNAERLAVSRERVRRLADAGRLPEIQVDQTVQDELRARSRLVSAERAYEQALDAFKIDLGLPTDARVDLDDRELERLAALTIRLLDESDPSAAASLPSPAEAVDIALARRLDLHTAADSVEDARRAVRIAEDALRAGLKLTANASAGEGRSLSSAAQPDAELRFDRGSYGLGLEYEAPWERGSERSAYRQSLIALDRRVRSLEALEDRIKLDIRSALRNLAESREAFRIQAQAVDLARRRVDSSELYLQAGRAETRDILEAEEALVSAQDALTSALVRYRVAELALQRDMDTLNPGSTRIWNE